MTDVSIGTTNPIAPVVDPTPVGTAIVQTPTAVAPLTASDGVAYVVQVMIAGNGTINPANAQSWTHNSDGSLDVYDGNALLVASWPQGQWMNVQLVTLD